VLSPGLGKWSRLTLSRRGRQDTTRSGTPRRGAPSVAAPRYGPPPADRVTLALVHLDDRGLGGTGTPAECITGTLVVDDQWGRFRPKSLLGRSEATTLGSGSLITGPAPRWNLTWWVELVVGLGMRVLHGHLRAEPGLRSGPTFRYPGSVPASSRTRSPAPREPRASGDPGSSSRAPSGSSTRTFVTIAYMDPASPDHSEEAA
jgi:hypothetical protein